MDTVMAVQGPGFVMMAADCSSARSILVFNQDEDKLFPLDEMKLLGQSGPQCDTKNFSEYIQKNMELYALNNNMRLSTHATANYMRREMATALRKGPYQTNILLGGYDENAGATLHFIDMYASLQKVKFGVHGHASNFLLSVFDRMYVEDLSEEQAMAIVEKCIEELHTRFLISQPNFVIKVVDAKGVRVIRGPPSV
jgi:20S proteasome alpha/beta subunit